MKCFSITVRISASSGAPISTAGTAFSRDLRSGSETPHRLGAALGRDEDEQPLLARQVQEMEQRLLVVGDAIGVLDHERRPLAHGVEALHGECFWTERLRARHRLPDACEMRLAARLGADQQMHLLLPIGPGVDQPDCGEIAVADEEILRAQRRTMRQVERELSDRHEALTRERCGRSSPAAGLCRGGSGAGAGS